MFLEVGPAKYRMEANLNGFDTVTNATSNYFVKDEISFVVILLKLSLRAVAMSFYF